MEAENRVGQLLEVGQINVPGLGGVADQPEQMVNDVGLLLLTAEVVEVVVGRV
ncbi:hypothetical protein [Streptomyces decoyicus]